MATAYATGVLVSRIPKTSSYSHISALPHLPLRSVRTSISSSSKHFPDSNRLTLFRIKASSSEETSGSADVGEVFLDLKEKWDALEDKSTVVLYGGGAIVAVWLTSVFIGAINSVPVLPKIMELVGLGYTGWFVYRYLLFKMLVFV
ncbi:protein CURVATURE THYLAKOID 1A, chloroplastic-like isoform X2 [Cornus florida]|uniref:protein CURVATURE THYLAKOID 1A, chloroplastic-like isoform X2 n=1 Tax=Cornus florida TaxID=4283 RepID=UPI00289E54D1|nr:protein CURVATURE THYLAKOID 1A, chloroplastic-like isoform X2 [Cornus florida]